MMRFNFGVMPKTFSGAMSCVNLSRRYFLHMTHLWRYAELASTHLCF
jgi:hypothetical protein